MELNEKLENSRLKISPCHTLCSLVWSCAKNRRLTSFENTECDSRGKTSSGPRQGKLGKATLDAMDGDS